MESKRTQKIFIWDLVNTWFWLLEVADYIQDFNNFVKIDIIIRKTECLPSETSSTFLALTLDSFLALFFP